jgi:thioredoxin-dependent peroxiredoxin
MQIQSGMTAPTFQTEDLFGNAIKLKDFAGKWVLLSFLRNGACAMCNLRVHQMIERYPGLHVKGLEMLTVFESPRSSIAQYVGKQDAPFAIIPDPQAKLYVLYGVESSEEKINAVMTMPETHTIVQEAAAHGFVLTPEEGSNFFRMPADFLIAPDGTVRIAHYTNHVYDHLEFDAIEHQLDLDMDKIAAD